MRKPESASLLSGALAAAALLASLAGPAPAQPRPLTTAEASEWKATSRYADVMRFVGELQRLSPLVRVETLCTSAEGRDVPLLVIGRPLPGAPSELRRDGRAVVYIQANIHAGEVEGKEASLMLARDIVLDEKTPYLDRLVLLIAPDFNADGNERISPENRRHQPGPEQGVGVRFNGQNLDLNRDGMKLETPEVNGLLANVLNRWDPVLLVDCHTTNGSYHQEVVTYDWAMNPNGDPGLVAFQRDRMMPAIEDILEKKYDTPAVGYGEFRDFRAPEKGWEAREHEPRYLTNYVGLRNRLAILDENYVYADFRTRVMGNYAFLRAILDYTSAHLEEIDRLVGEADRRTILRGLRPSAKDVLYIEDEVRPLKKPVTIHAYEVEITPQGEGRRPLVKPTDRLKVVTVPYYADWVGKTGVPFPFAYLMTIRDDRVIANLRRHGIVVERLVEPATLDVATFKPREIKTAGRLFQGHWMDQVKGDYVPVKREFPAGTYVVATAQPLGGLAAYLLEPESDDGLLVWNFFDRYLVPEWSREFETYPVCKLMSPAHLVKEVVGR